MIEHIFHCPAMWECTLKTEEKKVLLNLKNASKYSRSDGRGKDAYIDAKLQSFQKIVQNFQVLSMKY